MHKVYKDQQGEITGVQENTEKRTQPPAPSSIACEPKAGQVIIFKKVSTGRPTEGNRNTGDQARTSGFA